MSGSKTAILAIETSCDETAAAVMRLCLKPEEMHKGLLSDVCFSQVEAHREFGGVVPELASRSHAERLPGVVSSALSEAQVSLDEIDHIAVTSGPGLKGCLLVGLNYAKALAYAHQCPLTVVNHCYAHLASAFLTASAPKITFPVLGLLVSGGHTMLLDWRSVSDVRVVADTRDDAAGEAFDKIATLLGFQYPGGASLSQVAAEGDGKSFDFPRGMRGDETVFSFSGFKTAVSRAIREHGILGNSDRQNFAASVQYTIVETLIDKFLLALSKCEPRSVILCGGVAANTYLRERIAQVCLAENLPVIIPERKWCTDNAAMVAAAAQLTILDKRDAYEAWQPRQASSELGPGVSFSVGAQPRWSLEELWNV